MKSKQKVAFYVLSIAVATWTFSYSAKATDSNPPEPTVEGCIEKTGFTEEKCEEMIEKMKNMKPGERGDKGRGGPQGNGENEPFPGDKREESASAVEMEIRMAERMKSGEENMFSRTKTRVEKIIEFLESKDIDVDTIEENLETFESKSDTLINAIDSYIAILEELQDDDAAELSTEAKESRENIKDLLDDLRDFYKNTLRENIKTQIDKLDE